MLLNYKLFSFSAHSAAPHGILKSPYYWGAAMAWAH